MQGEKRIGLPEHDPPIGMARVIDRAKLNAEHFGSQDQCLRIIAARVVKLNVVCDMMLAAGIAAHPAKRIQTAEMAERRRHASHDRLISEEDMIAAHVIAKNHRTFLMKVRRLG